ncbi:MAG TPA: zinc ribbon domain-containing protein [Candidatus Polarisedimenticolaceae bacterium]|nr:zinc ribbon domain-containing protein [Candidatus Polarisedimenticolaceae bacterium]
MPIYEYRCIKCGHHIEIIQKLSDRPLRKCPECGGRLEKLVSRAAFLLKGGGWYAEGYSKSADQKAEAEPAASPAKAETKGAASPDESKSKSKSNKSKKNASST